MRARGVSKPYMLVNPLVSFFLVVAPQCRRDPNSPSILEGVPVGRGSNISIRIPFGRQQRPDGQGNSSNKNV